MTEFDTREKLEEIVPHRGKMLLLDRIVDVDYEQKLVSAEIDISEKSMFYEESLGGVPVWISFEYMAQAISALSGILGRMSGTSPKMGMILSVSDFLAEEQAFLCGKTVRVNVRETIRTGSVFSFDGEAFVGDRRFATATIRVAEVSEPEKFLGG